MSPRALAVVAVVVVGVMVLAPASGLGFVAGVVVGLAWPRLREARGRMG